MPHSLVRRDFLVFNTREDATDRLLIDQVHEGTDPPDLRAAKNLIGPAVRPRNLPVTEHRGTSDKGQSSPGRSESIVDIAIGEQGALSFPGDPGKAARSQNVPGARAFDNTRKTLETRADIAAGVSVVAQAVPGVGPALSVGASVVSNVEANRAKEARAVAESIARGRPDSFEKPSHDFFAGGVIDLVNRDELPDIDTIAATSRPGGSNVNQVVGATSGAARVGGAARGAPAVTEVASSRANQRGAQAAERAANAGPASLDHEPGSIAADRLAKQAAQEAAISNNQQSISDFQSDVAAANEDFSGPPGTEGPGQDALGGIT